MARRRTEVHFWSNVAIGTPDACWEWQGARKDGTHHYGRFRATVAGRYANHSAHRVAWFLMHGEWPQPGVVVCHSCDNPPCCNPSHLWLGTQRDNARDRGEKGRYRGRRPEPSGCLSDDQRAEIVLRYRRGGTTQRQLADEYGISRSWVGKLVTEQEAS